MAKQQNIRISDIAKMANVSKGTVDRVLHNRGRVSEEKRKKIEEVLKEINYEPNKIARFLASKKTYNLAVVIPSYTKGEYWELVASGIDKAVDELKDFYVSVDYLFFDQHDSNSMKQLVKEFDAAKYAGALVATLFRKYVVQLSQILDVNAVPYIYIDSNLSEQNNISYFGVDSVVSGSIAAKLILSEIGKNGTIIIAQTEYEKNEGSTQIESREKGFLEYLKQEGFLGEVCRFNFNPRQKKGVGEELKKMLYGNKEAIGGVVFNSRIYEFIELLEKYEYNPQAVTLIGYDPVEKNLDALMNDKIKFLISQRSITQGYDSLKALSNLLIFETKLRKENYMPIDILIKENIKYYTD